MMAAANCNTPRTDAAALEQALRMILEPGQVTELRILEAVTASDRRPHVISGYFDYEHIGDLAQAAASVLSAKGFYFIPNAVKPELLARAFNRARNPGKEPTTADHDIERRHWLLFDCDCKRATGISATDAEHVAAIERARQIRDYLGSLGWNDPILADSGNGGHLLYPIDLPVDDGGLVQKCLEAIDVRFSGEGVDVDLTVFNPARIWKLYGTVAGKGDSTPDRPHRLSKILEVPDDLYPVPVDYLEALAAKAPKPESPEWTPNGSGDRYKRFSIDDWIHEHNLDVEAPQSWQGSGRKWMFRTCPFNSDHTDRSAIIGQRTDGKLLFNCSHNSCASYHWPDLRELVEPGHRERKAAYQGNGHVNRSGTAAPNVKQEAKKFPIYTSDALDRMEFDENAIIENALIEGQPGGFFGGSKMLKTTLALDAGISVASGTNFLGCDFFRVPRARRVMIMSAESGLKALQGTARRIANARDLELAEFQNLLWSDRVPFLGNDVDPQLLGEQIKEHGVELLFLDPAYQMFDPRDSGNLFAQGIQLRRLLDVCRDASCDFVLLHHTTRHASKQCEQPNLTDASWAGFSEFVGQWILVARRRPYIAGSGVHELWLVLGARGAHQASWALDVNEHSDEWGKPHSWAVTVMPASEAQAAVDDGRAAKEARKAAAAQERNVKRLEGDKEAILKVLQQLWPDGETKNQLRALTKLNNARIVSALEELESEKQIEEFGKPKGNKKTPGNAYRLRRNQ